MQHMHSEKVRGTCNTIKYAMAFLHSDWLYFLWYGINTGSFHALRLSNLIQAMRLFNLNEVIFSRKLG